MLTIHLEEGTGHRAVSLPPAPHVRLKGCDLCIGPDDRPIVRNERRLWTYGAVSFLTAVIDQPIRLRFESQTGHVSDGGCHEGLRISDGNLFAGGKAGRILASYDDTSQRWTRTEEADPMSQVLILPAVSVRDIGESSFEN